MTPAQLQTFATAMQAETDPIVVAALAAGNNTGIVDWYNSQAIPDYYVWRNAMPVNEIQELVDWDEVVGLGTADSLGFGHLLAQVDGVLNPSKASIRQAFASVFSGPSGVVSRTALSDAAKIPATNIQKVFATDGDGSVGTPSVTAIDACTLQNVRDALALIP